MLRTAGANPPPRPEQELVVYGLFGVISLLKCASAWVLRTPEHT